MKQYKVISNKLRLFLYGIKEMQLRERYQMFISLHEQIHYQYSNDNSKPMQELRVAAEALCKLLIFVYVPNADQLFDDTDRLSHTYFKMTDNSSSDYLKIKEEPLSASPTYRNWCDRTELGQLAYALLCKKDEKEDSKNRIYNKIKECYENLYAPLNTDTSHAVPSAKQSLYDAPTLYSFYFGWVRSIIDLCSDKLSELKGLLPFENTIIEENVKKDIELEQLISEDEGLKELHELEGDFKHEYGKKYILIVSSTLRPELKVSLARIGWNMVIDFDPCTQESGGLYNVIDSLWNGKREALYTDIETNGDKITYWVEANGNTSTELSYSEDDVKLWKKTNLAKIIKKIHDLESQKPIGDIVIIDLYSQSKFPLKLYSDSRLLQDNNITILRFLSLAGERIDDRTNEDIEVDVKEYIIDQNKLAKYFNSLDNNLLDGTSNFVSGCPDITPDVVNKLMAYGIESVPEISLTQEKKELGISFCSGNPITWNELYCDIDVERTGYKNFYKKIAEYVNRGRKFFEYIVHDPCSGGTTLARRLAYDLRNKDVKIAEKCYVVFLTEFNSTRTKTFQKLRSFIEDTLPADRMLIIIIDRTISDENIEELRKSCIRPTHNVSIIRVTYDSSYRRDNCLSIKESIMPNEKPDFNRLYEKLCTGISKMELKYVIDFPLSSTNFKNIHSVDAYVQEWMKKIEPKYQDVIQHFSILVAIASLYVYDSDRYVYTEFTNPIFERSGNRNIWYLLNLMSKSSKDAFGKIFNVEYNEEGKRTGRIRPRFSLFARSIIKNSKIGIFGIAKDYIEHISKWKSPDRNKYIRDVFVKRSDFEIEDPEGKITLYDKVSSFFKDNKCDSETVLKVFKLLVTNFPKDEICLLSYSQYLYNKAYYEDKDSHDGRAFVESERILLGLQEMVNDKLFHSLVHQSIGVLYFRKIGVLRDILYGTNSANFTSEDYNCVLRYCHDCSENCDKSTELDPTSAYGLVTKAQMLKTVLRITKRYKKYSDWTFCETDKIYQDISLDYLDACSKIAKFSHEEDTRANSDYKFIGIFNKLDDFRKELNGGEGKEFFEKYNKKLQSTKDEKLKIIYGYRLYDTVISLDRRKIRECIEKLPDRYISRIEEATKYNARKGISGAYEKLLNLKIYNSRTEDTIENVIELLKEWKSSAKSNEEYLWINYYFMTFYAVQMLNEGHANEGLLKRYDEARQEASRYCELANLKEYDAYAYLYYRASRSKGLDSITEKRDNASSVQGTISVINANNRKRGWAKLNCGLMASFAAKDRKYIDADINVTKIEGIIGFRFNGLGFYKQDIVMESINEKSEEYSIQTEDFVEKDSNEADLPNNRDTTMGSK